MSTHPNIPCMPTVSSHPFTTGISDVLSDTGRSDEQLFEQLSIEHPNDAVEAIACDVGLPNVSTFYRLFKAK